MQTGDRNPPASGRVSLLAALACAGATLLLLRLGSGHTPASQRFAALPQFDVWIWIYAAEVGAAAALGIASFPAFRLLAQATDDAPPYAPWLFGRCWEYWSCYSARRQ